MWASLSGTPDLRCQVKRRHESLTNNVPLSQKVMGSTLVAVSVLKLQSEQWVPPIPSEVFEGLEVWKVQKHLYILLLLLLNLGSPAEQVQIKPNKRPCEVINTRLIVGGHCGSICALMRERGDKWKQAEGWDRTLWWLWKQKLPPAVCGDHDALNNSLLLLFYCTGTHWKALFLHRSDGLSSAPAPSISESDSTLNVLKKCFMVAHNQCWIWHIFGTIALFSSFSFEPLEAKIEGFIRFGFFILDFL